MVPKTKILPNAFLVTDNWKQELFYKKYFPIMTVTLSRGDGESLRENQEQYYNKIKWGEMNRDLNNWRWKQKTWDEWRSIRKHTPLKNWVRANSVQRWGTHLAITSRRALHHELSVLGNLSPGWLLPTHLLLLQYHDHYEKMLRLIHCNSTGPTI